MLTNGIISQTLVCICCCIWSYSSKIQPQSHTKILWIVLFVKTYNVFTGNYQQLLLRLAADWQSQHEFLHAGMSRTVLDFVAVTAVTYSYKDTLDSQVCSLIQKLCLSESETTSCSDWRLTSSYNMCLRMLVCHGHFWSLLSLTAVIYSHKHTGASWIVLFCITDHVFAGIWHQ